MTRISIVIPTFNGSEVIRDTLNGVLRQTYRDYEIIVVDDGSTDFTPDIVKQMIPSAKIIKQPNRGTMAARQVGIEAAVGDVIALLDQDDIWFPEMLKTEVEVLEEHPEIGLVLANMIALDENGKQLGFNVVPPDRCYTHSWEKLLLITPLATSTVLFRKNLISKLGSLDTRFGSSGAMGDLDMVLRISEMSQIIFIDKCMGYYYHSEFRPGRLLSFLNNLEIYVEKYLNHPRLSGVDGVDLRAKFVQSCSGYSIYICQMIMNHEGINIPLDLQQKLERHQTTMHQLLGDIYQPVIKRQIPNNKVTKIPKVLVPFVILTGKLFPLGGRRRRVFAPFLNAGRILFTEGPTSLVHKSLLFFKIRHNISETNDDTQSLSLVPKMQLTKKKKILVLDDYIPAIRYGSGFPRLYKMLTCLGDLGYLTTFFPVGNPVKVQPETSELQSKGLEVFWGNKISFEEFAKSRSGIYDVVMVSRPHVFRRLYPLIVRTWPGAAIIYDAEALFFARDIVQAEISGKAMQESEKTKIERDEMELIEKADLVISVSEKTKDIMLENSSQKNIEVWEHIQKVYGSTVPFNRRQGLLHFGSFFAGPGCPNEDAVLYFVNEIFPEVRKTLACKLYVVGTSPTPAVMKLNTQDIEVVGYAETPKTYFDMCKVNIVPTRVFATGTPLKLIEAMSYGIPSVVNGPIARHLGLNDGKEALVADNSKEFAEKVIQLYSDESLWNHIKDNSIKYVTNNYSNAKLQQRMELTIKRVLEIKSHKLRT